jgi:PRC-barrel domain.
VVEDDFPKTVEVPPGGADAAGLEDYGVELRGGERLGTIVDSVAEGDRRWLVVETGLPPFKRNRRAIPWSEIQDVDHDALLVTVAASTAETFPRLPEAGREDEAPARRVTESPDAPRYVPTGDVAGPTDRNTLLFGALASFALGLLTLLAIIALLSRRGDHELVWGALALPVVLLLAAGILGYRLWRDPYSRER